jgi:hypothetical protein
MGFGCAIEELAGAAFTRHLPLGLIPTVGRYALSINSDPGFLRYSVGASITRDVNIDAFSQFWTNEFLYPRF